MAYPTQAGRQQPFERLIRCPYIPLLRHICRRLQVRQKVEEEEEEEGEEKEKKKEEEETGEVEDEEEGGGRRSDRGPRR